MALNDLYSLKVNFNDIRNEFSTTTWYQQTVEGGEAEEAPFNLARGWWSTFCLAGGPFMDLLADDCHANSTYARFVPAFGGSQNQVPGFYVTTKEPGTRPGQPLGGANALKIRSAALIGTGGGQVNNYISVSGISETELTNGAWNAAYLGGPVQAMLNQLALAVTDVGSGDAFQHVVAFDPLAATRNIGVPLVIKATSSVLNQRIRYSERIGTA